MMHATFPSMTILIGGGCLDKFASMLLKNKRENFKYASASGPTSLKPFL
jgi:hypothetical protein